MSAQGQADTGLSGGRLLALRVMWIALVTLTVALFVVGIPASFRQLQTTCGDAPACASFQLYPEDARALQDLGLSMRSYAAYGTSFTLFALLTFYLAAAALFWRNSSTWMAIFYSFVLVAVGPAFFSNVTGPLVRATPAWRLPVGFLKSLGLWLALVVYYLFPNGRFVPRWTRILAVLIAPYALLRSYTGFLLPLQLGGMSVGLVLVLLLVGWFFAGLAAQVYRYRRVSGPVERQQTKWVVFGFAAYVLDEGVFYLSPLIFPSLRQPGLPHLLHTLVGGTLNVTFLLLLQFTLAISILRFRLWDIDILINRTLVYGALTAALALVYFGSVVVLQGLFRTFTGQVQNQLVTVISTLAIAALFAPLRRQVQAGIDHRFYRRKYDAAQAMAAFSATARDEVDLQTLSERLVSVVEETMQPAHVTLWLRKEKAIGRK